jgi:hypothetical protein
MMAGRPIAVDSVDRLHLSVPRDAGLSAMGGRERPPIIGATVQVTTVVNPLSLFTFYTMSGGSIAGGTRLWL